MKKRLSLARWVAHKISVWEIMTVRFVSVKICLKNTQIIGSGQALHLESHLLDLLLSWQCLACSTLICFIVVLS